MEYLTNSNSIDELFDYNKESNKEYESYEKYLQYYYQLPSKKDPYDRDMKDGKYILSDVKNPDKKITIEPSKYIDLNVLFNKLKTYNKIILEKISILIEKPSNFDEEDRKYFNELKKNYGVYSKKIQEIDAINQNHFEYMEQLTIKKIDNSLLMAKYYNERNSSFKEINEPILKESKAEIIKSFNKNGRKIPTQESIDKLGKKLHISSNEMEKWFYWTDKCFHYLQAKYDLYRNMQEQNIKDKEFNHKCKIFIIKKPIINS